MGNLKKDNIIITELLITKADWKRTFIGIQKKVITNNDIVIYCGKVKVNEGEIVSCAETEKELWENLDTICKFKLDFNLHNKGYGIKKNINNKYSLN